MGTLRSGHKLRRLALRSDDQMTDALQVVSWTLAGGVCPH